MDKVATIKYRSSEGSTTAVRWMWFKCVLSENYAASQFTQVLLLSPEGQCGEIIFKDISLSLSVSVLLDFFSFYIYPTYLFYVL